MKSFEYTKRIEVDTLKSVLGMSNMRLQVLGITHYCINERRRDVVKLEEAGEQVFLIHKFVISVTDLARGDTKTSHSNLEFSALHVILNRKDTNSPPTHAAGEIAVDEEIVTSCVK